MSDKNLILEQIRKIDEAIEAQKGLEGIITVEQIETAISSLQQERLRLIAQIQSLDINIEGSSAGGDIMASTQGDVHKIASQINNPTNINLSTNSLFRPGSAPPRPSFMIGRDDDVKALKERLSITSDGKTSLQVLTAIKGWPGVGKTTVASALAYDPDIEKIFPDGVLWTSLGQDPNILSEMATWGRALGTDDILKAKSVEEAQNLLAGLLRNKRMLLIIDDVWKAEDVFPFKVGGLGCATLITTRIPRHMIRGNNLFLFDPLCQIFSPDQMAKTSPSALLFFKNISALPFRPENTRVAYQVSYSPNG